MNISEKRRYHLLDEIRGIAVLCMIFYHSFYTAAFLFENEFAQKLYNFFMPAEPFFACVFIVISGICTQFSRSNLRRGIILGLIAAAISVITVFVLPKYGFVYCEIYFGILHLLSVGILLSSVLNKIFEKSVPSVLIVIFAVLFFATYNFSFGEIGLGRYVYTLPETFSSNNSLFFLGCYGGDFFSADYFPLIPWLFMFLCGECIGVYAKRGKFPNFFLKKRVAVFAFFGRHALWFYLLHQPVIYLVSELIRFIVLKGNPA